MLDVSEPTISRDYASELQFCRLVPRASIGIILSLILFIASAGGQSSPLAHEMLNAILSERLVNDETGDIPIVLGMLAAHTKFARHVNINKNPDAKSIKFYLLPPHLIDRHNLPEAIWSSQILGNCLYIGISNAIVCDPDFLDSFLDTHRVFSGGLAGIIGRRADQFAFLAWVLGHELGHVVHGTTGHFGEAHVIDRPVTALELRQKDESDADLFAARQILKNRPVTRDLEGILIALINREVIDKTGDVSAAYGVGLQYDYQSQAMIQYSTMGDHPEFVIRGTRMLDEISKGTKDPALQNLVRTFERHLTPVAN